MSTRVSIIIPAWNLWDMTKQCLESLAAHTQGDHVQVVVVDNGSSDATALALTPTLHELFGPRGLALRMEHNLGFAKGCNAGAAAAEGELLFFLNNDTLATENWLPPLLSALDSPFVGMAGPLLLLPRSHRVQHCGIAFAPTLEVSHLYSLFPGDHPLVRKSRVLQALTGAALLLPKALFLDCGGFHEGYVNGFEDMDLCCAVRRKGMRLISAPQSVLYHLTSQTPGRFDHDGPNARLLNERQPNGCAPDLHTLGAEDGYVPLLSPALEIYFTLPPAKEAALTQGFSQFWDADRCWARLQAEPLWQGGYTLLARHLESQGQWADAAEIRSLMTHFFPLAEHAAALGRAAARGGDAALAKQASQAVHDLQNTAADTDAQRKKADTLARWGEDAGDAALAKLFRHWLTQHSHQL